MFSAGDRSADSKQASLATGLFHKGVVVWHRLAEISKKGLDVPNAGHSVSFINGALSISVLFHMLAFQLWAENKPYPPAPL